MNPNTMVFSTINIEELPLHVEHHAIHTMRPSAIEEDEDDPRSLLYLFDDNDFERAAAYLAIEEARQQAQARAEAIAEAEAQQRRAHRIQMLAACLEQLLEDDDELVDLLGRRILATNGYQVPDLWQPDYHHHHHPRGHYYHYGANYHPQAQYYGYRPQVASSSSGSHNGLPLTIGAYDQSQARDIHASWDHMADEDSLAAYARANPFIHAAPVILRGHSPFKTRSPERVRPSSMQATASSRSPAGKSTASTNARIAIHPITGVPVLLVQEEKEEEEGNTDASGEPRSQQADTNDDETGESEDWPVEDEQDLEWLGRELLRRRGGANVWVLGADTGVTNKTGSNSVSESQSQASQTPAPSSTAAATSSSTLPASTGSVAGNAPATPTLPVEVEEVDSDRELADVAKALDPNRRESAASLNSPSHRIAAALAQAALQNPASSHTQARRQRAATVMSESEEEELETVGRPVDESQDEARKDDAASLNDRPRKTVKIVDRR